MVDPEARLLELEHRIAHLEAELGRVTGRSVAEARDAPVLRVRGIIVEDERGRPRILVGAPVQEEPARKRIDATTALVVLDERGIDRVIVGFVPDQQVQGQVEPRGTAVAGVGINDQDGNERGGFGIFDASGNVGMGLDYPGGREAVSLFVMRNGLAGFAVNDRHLDERICLTFNGDDGTGAVLFRSIGAPPHGWSTHALCCLKGLAGCPTRGDEEAPVRRALMDGCATTEGRIGGMGLFFPAVDGTGQVALGLP